MGDIYVATVRAMGVNGAGIFITGRGGVVVLIETGRTDRGLRSSGGIVVIVGAVGSSAVLVFRAMRAAIEGFVD